jgi:copper chaperone CopZ
MNKKLKYSIILIVAMLVFNLRSTTTIAQEDTGKAYIQIRVDGLSCPFCAYGLEKKLKKVDGAKNLLIELEEGLVSLDVPNNKKPSEAAIKKIVTDAGFTPRAIKFSDTPFKNEDEAKK